MTNSKFYCHNDVLQVRKLHSKSTSLLYKGLALSEFLEIYATELREASNSKSPLFAIEVSNYYKPLLGKSHNEIQTMEFESADFLAMAANVHGFENFEWERTEKINPKLQKTIDKMLDGDIDFLRRSLEKEPELISISTRFGHKAKLIHYCASNAVEIYRQRVPYRLIEITEILMEAGADLVEGIPVYGGSFNTVELFATSIHPVKAGVNKDFMSRFGDSIN